MGRIIAVVNQKGGVGKTTTAVNLSACLADLGQKVLLVDIDPQGNATSGLGIDRKRLTASVYDVLIEGLPARQAVIATNTPNLWALPSDINLAGAEVELVAAISRENKLRKALYALRNQYDFIYIDCPPSLGLLTINALTAADALLIPIQCEYYAMEGLSQLLGTYKLVRENLNPELAIEGVLLTMYDARTNLGAQVVDEVQKHFRGRVYRSIIYRNVRLAEAPSHGEPIHIYDRASKGAEAYYELAREVIERVEKKVG